MFQIAKRLVADVPPFSYYEGTDGEMFELGEALKFSAGKLTKASGTDKVTHICAGVKNASGMIPVYKVTQDFEFVTTATATVGISSIGTAVTLHTDGLQVTATTGGVFTVSGIDGEKVYGYFN